MSLPTVPATTQQYSKAIDPAVRKFYNDEYERLDPMVEKIFRVGEQIDANQQEQTMFGLAELSQVNEAAIYPEDVPLEGYTTIYTPVKYGVDVPITLEMMKYDKSGLFKYGEIAKQQARSSSVAVSKQGANVFNKGFNTSFTSYGDNKPLFSTDHTRADGNGSQSNASANGILLTEANYETALLQFRQQLDDRGLPISSIPDTLLVPIALEKEALIIVKSTSRSATADNDANVYNMREYTGGRSNIIAWNFLSAYLGGSDTAWFLIDKAQHKVNWKWGWKPQIARKDDSVGYRNDTVYFKVSYQASTGWSDWRYTFGSQGNGLNNSN